MSTTPVRRPRQAPASTGRACAVSTVASRGSPTAAAETATIDVRDRILDTASKLFYQRGVRAVGVDLVVREAAVAKMSLYRHFPTKDDLIVAFLEREDLEFWQLWDSVGQQHLDPVDELKAHMRWIGERLARENYRGCPQINVAAEFAGRDHPARQVAQRHMQSLFNRLHDIVKRLGIPRPKVLAAQLAVVINGAFVSSALLSPEDATGVLLGALKALLAGAQART
ncbi:MAG: TetR/AcrR family transcriptional regulator [Caldimonas sp.]